MGLESATHISDLNSANPVGATDSRRLGDDHIRLVKAVLLTDFANISGAVTASHAELNYVDVTAAGTAQASKAIILDGSKDITGLNIVTAVSFVGPLTGNVTGNVTGNIDGTVGAGTPASIIGTTIVANTSLDINGTIVLVGTIDDDSMAAATDTNISTSEAIKAYVDANSLATLNTVTTTAATTSPYTSILSTTTRIEIMIDTIQHGGTTQDIEMELGDGSFPGTYDFKIGDDFQCSGLVIPVKQDDDTWSYMVSTTNNGGIYNAGGQVGDLGGALDRIQIKCVSTFTSGRKWHIREYT